MFIFQLLYRQKFHHTLQFHFYNFETNLWKPNQLPWRLRKIPALCNILPPQEIDVFKAQEEVEKEACKSFFPYQISLSNFFNKSDAKNRIYLLTITQSMRETRSFITDIPLKLWWNECNGKGFYPLYLSSAS